MKLSAMISCAFRLSWSLMSDDISIRFYLNGVRRVGRINAFKRRGAIAIYAHREFIINPIGFPGNNTMDLVFLIGRLPDHPVTALVFGGIKSFISDGDQLFGG